MKRLLITTILMTCFLIVKGQESQISASDQEKSPLLVIQYDNEKIEFHDHNGSQLLKAIPMEEISSIEVLKGNSASFLYGDSGKNGVIMLTLLKSDGNDLLFRKLQAGKLPSPQIKTDVDISVNEKSSFTLDPSTLIKNGKVRIKGESQLGRNMIAPIIIVRLGSKEMELEKLSDLESLDAKHLKSINVLKAKGDNNGRDTVAIQLVQSSKTKRFFRKLQRNQKE